MGGLEEYVKIQTGLIAFELLKRARNDGARKARFVPREGVSLARERHSGRLFRWRCPDSLSSAPNYEHVRRDRYRNRRGKSVNAITIHREPATRIEQVTGIFSDLRQSESLHQAFISLQHAFVIKCQRGS